MHFLDVISVWTYFIATIVIASLSFEGGYQIGVILLRKNKIHATPPFEGLSPAILGLLVLCLKSFARYFQFKAPGLNDRKWVHIRLYGPIFDRSTAGAFNLKIAVKTFETEY